MMVNKLFIMLQLVSLKTGVLGLPPMIMTAPEARTLVWRRTVLETLSVTHSRGEMAPFARLIRHRRGH